MSDQSPAAQERTSNALPTPSYRDILKLVIPQHLRPLFWDVDLDRFDPIAHPRYTIERVLEHGEEEDVAWLLRTFAQQQIQVVLRSDHRLSPRSANFWALVFEVPVHEVAALQR